MTKYIEAHTSHKIIYHTCRMYSFKTYF